MKKAAMGFGLIMLSVLVLCGCSAAQKNGPNGTAEKLLKAIYTVDADNIEDYTILRTEFDELKKDYDQETGTCDISKTVDGPMQTLHKNILPLVTEKEYENILNNRYYSNEAGYCLDNDFTLQITNISLDKNEPAEDENSAGYYYKVDLKHVSADGQSDQESKVQGYIGLVKENDNWKVSLFTMKG
ncbi:MAG: hypothetical protein WCG21_14640 [Eubacteriales bacterium]